MSQSQYHTFIDPLVQASRNAYSQAANAAIKWVQTPSVAAALATGDWVSLMPHEPYYLADQVAAFLKNINGYNVHTTPVEHDRVAGQFNNAHKVRVSMSLLVDNTPILVELKPAGPFPARGPMPAVHTPYPEPPYQPKKKSLMEQMKEAAAAQEAARVEPHPLIVQAATAFVTQYATRLNNKGRVPLLGVGSPVKNTLEEPVADYLALEGYRVEKVPYEDNDNRAGHSYMISVK